MSIALAIFVLTLGAVVFFRRKIPEWAAAASGALAVVAFGIETPLQAAAAVGAQWNVILFFLGLALLIAIADVFGVFRNLALRAARGARGSAPRLFASILGLTAIITAALTNDAAVLVLAPLVAELAGALALPPAPFAIGIALMANAGSALLPISNPSNFIVADAVHWNLPEYVAMVTVPALAALAAAWIVVRRYFGGMLGAPYDAAPDVEGLYRPALMLLGSAACAMLVASLLRWPVGAVCAGCAVAGASALAARRPHTVLAAARTANFGLAVLAGGFFVVVDGLRAAGALGAAVRGGVHLMGYGHAVASVGAMAASALASNLFNNLPAAMLAAQFATHPTFAVARSHEIAAGAIVGLAAGPNLTTFGSLSTMLVLIELRRRGIALRSRDFLLPGALVTFASLGAAAVAFYGMAVVTKP